MVPGFKMPSHGPHRGREDHKPSHTLDIPDGPEIFAIFTEPRYDVLGGDVLDKIHYRYVAPASMDWASLIQAGRLVNTMSNEALQKMSSIAGASFTQYLDLISICNNFVDQRGQSFGDVATWGTNRLLWIDSLTGLSKMARKIRAGNKPVLTQPDWGVSMSLGTRAHRHPRHRALLPLRPRRPRGARGGRGLRLGPRHGEHPRPQAGPRDPRQLQRGRHGQAGGRRVLWSTTEGDADLKSCYLPLSSKLPPNFAPLWRSGSTGVEQWCKRHLLRGMWQSSKE